MSKRKLIYVPSEEIWESVKRAAREDGRSASNYLIQLHKVNVLRSKSLHQPEGKRMKGGRPRVLYKTIDGVEHKQCFRCKGWFLLKLFGNCKGKWDGLREICKACESEKGKKYYSENKEQKNKKNRLYREVNKEQVRARDRKYYRKKHGPKIERQILHKFIDGVEHKRCSTCKDWFPLQLFYNKKKEWDGLNCACKKCKAIARLKYYANNKKAIAARSKEKVEEETNPYIMI